MALFPIAKDVAKRATKSHLGVALTLVVVLIIWLASGDTFRARENVSVQAAAPAVDAPPRVETRLLQAKMHQPEQVAQGELLPVKEVDIRSQISAHLSESMVKLGDSVAAGAVVFQLEQDDRAAQLARAEAELKLAEAELRAGERLFKRELMSETDLLRLQAAVAATRAQRELAERQLAYAQINAPFAGIVDRLPVEEGDFIQVGQSLATLVDVSELELSAFVPQQKVQSLEPGLPVEAILLDGTRMTGRLSYVASRAESSTRSFRVEALIDNPAFRRIAGASATLVIKLPLQKAHRLTPALLVLEDTGQLGVKTIGPEQRVEFMPIEILSFDQSGVWVDGLPDEVELVTLGGGFVDVGDVVNPVRAGDR